MGNQERGRQVDRHESASSRSASVESRGASVEPKEHKTRGKSVNKRSKSKSNTKGTDHDHEHQHVHESHHKHHAGVKKHKTVSKKHGVQYKMENLLRQYSNVVHSEEKKPTDKIGVAQLNARKKEIEDNYIKLYLVAHPIKREHYTAEQKKQHKEANKSKSPEDREHERQQKDEKRKAQEAVVRQEALKTFKEKSIIAINRRVNFTHSVKELKDFVRPIISARFNETDGIILSTPHIARSAYDALVKNFKDAYVAYYPILKENTYDYIIDELVSFEIEKEVKRANRKLKAPKLSNYIRSNLEEANGKHTAHVTSQGKHARTTATLSIKSPKINGQVESGIHLSIGGKDKKQPSPSGVTASPTNSSRGYAI